MKPAFALEKQEGQESDESGTEEEDVEDTATPCEACGCQDGMTDPGNNDTCILVKNGRDNYCRTIALLFFNGVPWSVPFPFRIS